MNSKELLIELRNELLDIISRKQELIKDNATSPTEETTPKSHGDDILCPIEWIEQWTGGIDNLSTDMAYSVTGTHLKQILLSYRALYQQSKVDMLKSEEVL